MVDITKENSATLNWGLSRVATQIIVGSNLPVDLEIPNNVIINARNEQDIVDGLEQHNAGYIYKPQRFTFSLDVPSNTGTYRFLRELLLRRLQFKLRVSEDSRTNPNITNIDGYVREFEGLTEMLEGCVFDDMSEPFRVGQMPTVTFNGKALRFKTGNNTDDPTLITNNYGDGTYDTSEPTST